MRFLIYIFFGDRLSFSLSNFPAQQIETKMMSCRCWCWYSYRICGINNRLTACDFPRLYLFIWTINPLTRDSYFTSFFWRSTLSFSLSLKFPAHKIETEKLSCRRWCWYSCRFCSINNRLTVCDFPRLDLFVRTRNPLPRHFYLFYYLIFGDQRARFHAEVGRCLNRV